MADSAKPILIAGAIGGVALLGGAWMYAASSSSNAERDAVIRAEALNARAALEAAPAGAAAPEAEAQPEQPVETAAETPAPEPEKTEEPAEVAAAEPEKAEEPAETAQPEAQPEPEPEPEPEKAEAEAEPEKPAAEPEKPEAAEAEKPETEMAAASPEATAPAAAPAAAAAETAGDPAAGEKVFRKCKACHMVGDGAKNRVGPVLTGIVGKTKGSVDDFKYSDVFQQAHDAGEVWTPEALDAYLANPKADMPGNKMAFAGLRKEDDRADVIAYLASVE